MTPFLRSFPGLLVMLALAGFALTARRTQAGLSPIAQPMAAPVIDGTLGPAACSSGYVEGVFCLTCVGIYHERDPQNPNCARCAGSCSSDGLVLY